jgi:hypothetical protein
MDLATTIVLAGLVGVGVTLALWGVRRPATGRSRRPAAAVGLAIFAACAIFLVALAIGVTLAPP